MITENLSTLKIHKLTKEQYERELAAGRIDPTALYLTPDEETDLSDYATMDYSKKVSNLYNILDNSDWSNPVNQREDSGYAGLGYGIDRWRSNSSYTRFAVNDGYVYFGSSTYGNEASIKQYIEPGIIKDGLKYTVGCTLNNNVVYCLSGTASPSMSGIVRSFDQYTNITFDYDSSLNLYGVSLNTSSDAGIEIRNIFLYEGEYTTETLPKYKPKGFAHELLECQRYYYYTSQYTAYPAYRSTTSYAFITLPTKMRIDNPTVTGDFKVRGSIDNEGDATSVELSHVGYIGFGNTIRLSLIDNTKSNN